MQIQIPLTDTEVQILAVIRSLRPMESVVIRANGQGQVTDKLFVKRTESFYLTNGQKFPVIDKMSLQT